MSASSSKELVLTWVGIEEGSSVFRFPDQRLRLTKSEVRLFLPVLRNAVFKAFPLPAIFLSPHAAASPAGIEVIPTQNKSS